MAFSHHVIVVCILIGVHGQINPPIPVDSRTPGSVYGNGDDSAQIKLEAFLELLCPDSIASWPHIQNVSEHYQPHQVQVIIHFYTLPYHKNAGLTTQGFYLIEDALPDQKWNYAQRIFDNYAEFSNSNTALMTEPEIIIELSRHATQSTGINRNDFEDFLDEYRGATIRSWKYGSRKGVAGTPWYFVNGVDLGVPPTSQNRITFDQWREFLDPMLES